MRGVKAMGKQMELLFEKGNVCVVADLLEELLPCLVLLVFPCLRRA